MRSRVLLLVYSAHARTHTHTGTHFFNPWSVSLLDGARQHSLQHHFSPAPNFLLERALHGIGSIFFLSFSSRLIVSISFNLPGACCSLVVVVVGRSVDFYLFVFADLVIRSQRRQIVLIHSSAHEALRCWSCFSSRSIFPHSHRLSKLFHQRALSGSVFPTQTFLSRQEPLCLTISVTLCVNPSVGSGWQAFTVGCSGAVKSGLAGASLAAAAAATRQCVTRGSSVKWTEPSEPAKTHTRAHADHQRRGDPEQSPERRGRRRRRRALSNVVGRVKI